VGRSAQDGANLYTQLIFVMKTKAYGTQAQSRVTLSFPKSTYSFITAQVKEPDGRAILARELCYLLIRLALFVFGRHAPALRH
jgi:hypothetical protein